MDLNRFVGKLENHKRFFNAIDWFSSPLVFVGSKIFHTMRRIGLKYFPISKRIMFKIGVFPLRDLYYEPLFNPKYLSSLSNSARSLPGINLNPKDQLKLLEKFHFEKELQNFSLEKEERKIDYFYHNPSFGSGDAEFYYSIIRALKPKRIIEIGSGYSTLIAIKAIEENKKEQIDYNCDLICIEPFENPWLDSLYNVKIIRKRLEKMNLDLFKTLKESDILFIDSTHIIRPQGDVLREYLQILPILNSGVLVHIHDIFTPRDYPIEYITERNLFWNEQYLLEAFLTLNPSFTIIGALNFLKQNYFEKLTDVFPVLKIEPNREPGSFWIRKN